MMMLFVLGLLLSCPLLCDCLFCLLKLVYIVGTALVICLLLLVWGFYLFVLFVELDCFVCVLRDT